MRVPLTVHRATLLGAAFAIGCAPEAPPPVGQLVLHIDTDAPLPAAPGDPVINAALFDALRVDVLAGGVPIDGLAREFTVDERAFRERRVSIGVVAAPGRTDLAARVRLYRYQRQANGQPQPQTSLDTTLRLPAVRDGAVQHIATSLRVADVGRAVGYPTPIEPEPFGDAPSAVGTFRYSARVPCGGAPRPNEVCVPGGVFWFGGAATRDFGSLDPFTTERLVVVSPFFLDAFEVTEAELDALLAPGPVPPRDECDLAAADVAAACVSHDTALAACRARGATLPTEAQWEYVASVLGADLDWPWGSTAPTCADAAVGGAACPERKVGRPARFPRDAVTPIAGGPTIFDLVGNVSEWMLDTALSPREEPWGQPGLLIDPIGTAAAAAHVIRGANVNTPPALTRVTARDGTSGAHGVVGFRCARAAR